jgi:hypothetical protein
MRPAECERRPGTSPRLTVTKDRDTRQRVIEALRAPGAYHNPGLADEMQRALAGT